MSLNLNLFIKKIIAHYQDTTRSAITLLYGVFFISTHFCHVLVRDGHTPQCMPNHNRDNASRNVTEPKCLFKFTECQLTTPSYRMFI